MRHLKVVVYAICKNEEQFVERWVQSMKEADQIYVLDTGSTDSTVQKLKQQGVHVKTQKIIPWRFDVARNLSLEFVPKDTDICVCTDLDEVFEAGWREQLEKQWKNTTTRARYNYNWSFDVKGRPAVNFYIEKIHSRQGYVWTHPVHEVLTYQNGAEESIMIQGIILNHYPDHSKSRGSYLPLLELSVEEDPEDDRNMHYLGREYMYYGRWNDCIDTLLRHLSLKRATWKDERSASMRFIARSYTQLHRYEEAKMWLDRAMEETPYLRDPFMERAMLAYELKDWGEVEKYVLQALRIQVKEKTYINEPFSWNETPYDLLSLSYYYQNQKQKALDAINLAISIAPDNERLQKNRELIEQLEQ